MALNDGSLVNNLKHTINKLRITQLDGDGSVSSGGGSAFSNVLNNAAGDEKVFEVQINPDKYLQKYSIAYTLQPAINNDTPPSKNFHHVQGKDFTLSFTLDGTGVIPPSLTDVDSVANSVKTGVTDFAKRSVGLGGYTDTSYVSKRIEALRKVVYDFNPNTHQTPIVMVTWGDVPPFIGRLADLQVTYTLFSSDGAPLRAEIQLQFGEHQDAAQLAAGNAAGKVNVGLSSPDLTHRRTVKATDTLPLLCEDIYKDATFYWQVAEANNLTHFRDLKEGTELFFPPIER
jgi:Contractile injection system tube protein